jgi:hypothetical protein
MEQRKKVYCVLGSVPESDRLHKSWLRAIFADSKGEAKEKAMEIQPDLEIDSVFVEAN